MTGYLWPVKVALDLLCTTRRFLCGEFLGGCPSRSKSAVKLDVMSISLLNRRFEAHRLLFMLCRGGNFYVGLGDNVLI